MEENKPQNEHSQSAVVSYKGSGSTTRSGDVPAYYAVKTKIFALVLKLKHVKFCHKFCSWLKTNTSQFIVTMLGVWAAFFLTGYGEQKALDRATEQRLHLVVLEARDNIRIANEILEDYSKIFGINFKRLNSVAAIASFQDANVLSFLPHYKVSLLRVYVGNIVTLNQILQTHQGLLESQGYEITSAVNIIQQNVRLLVANVFASASVLQKELDEYFDDKAYDNEKIDRLNSRLEVIRMEVLKGEGSLPNED